MCASSNYCGRVSCLQDAKRDFTGAGACGLSSERRSRRHGLLAQRAQSRWRLLSRCVQLTTSTPADKCTDVGTSALIANGDIKLVAGTKLAELTETGAKFADGRTIDADVVVYATGFGDFKLALRKMFSEEVVAQTRGFWGVNGEGEINGVWRGSGHPGLYVMMGTFGRIGAGRVLGSSHTFDRQPADVSVPLVPYGVAYVSHRSICIHSLISLSRD